VDAAANNHAKSMLERDVANMTEYYGQYAPELLRTNYAKEMWALYEDGDLTADTILTGLFEEATEEADVDSVMNEIRSVLAEERKRKERLENADDDYTYEQLQ
jgi:RIO kinase 1